MTTLNVRVQSYEATIADAERNAAMAESDQDISASSTYTFPTWEALHRTLAPARIGIIQAMTGKGAMSIREVARKVGRDVKNVYTDIETLVQNGIVDKTSDGVIFPYDRIHIEANIEAAA